MNLINAVVNVQTKRYTGPAVVIRSNGDDTMTVREAQSNHEFRVHKDALTVAPVTEQSLAWITQQLLDAWQPFLARLARHLAERLQDYAKFGGADEANAVFQSYLDEPPRAFRALCRREV
jgi:hypothetical protein